MLYGLGLCAGIGGLELGVDLWLGGRLRTVCWVEKDRRCQSVLRARTQDGFFSDAPIWDDLATFDGRPWEGVDVVCAGFPCQRFSSAARGRNNAADLWPHVLRVVRESRPSVVVLENVPGAPWRVVSKDLQAEGFQTSLGVFGAEEVGAPHKRRRGFLLANSYQGRESLGALYAEAPSLSDLGLVRARPQPRTLGVADVTPSRLDRLQLLGNAVCPVQAAFALSKLSLTF